MIDQLRWSIWIMVAISMFDLPTFQIEMSFRDNVVMTHGDMGWLHGYPSVSEAIINSMSALNRASNIEIYTMKRIW